MLIIAVRSLILYILVVVVIRLMGKRQVGEMQPFELVIAIMIGGLAVIPMSNINIPLASSVISILVLLALEILLSLLNLYSEKARRIICGTPVVLIDNGKLVPESMRRQRVNVNDLLAQIRSKEYPNVSDVAYAIMETNGTLSVIPKADLKPPSAKELGKTVPPPRLPITLVVEGQVNLKNLAIAEITLEELIRLARDQQIEDLRDVFFAQLTTQGQVYFQKKER
ncbi:membrane protein [Clostridiales bacterium PH28_bin88]|nr:membrane protein [Clostridiales bacterium PH28_bin88]